MHERILKELIRFRNTDIVIAQARRAPYVVGKTMKEFARGRGLTFESALLALMELTKLQAVVWCRDINLDVAAQSLFDDRAFIASYDPGFSEHNTSVSGAFTSFLRMGVISKLFPIERIIQKFTSLPAKTFQLKRRGEIKEGNFADLILIKENRVTDVFVNGEIVVKKGEVSGILAGNVLKRSL